MIEEEIDRVADCMAERYKEGQREGNKEEWNETKDNALHCHVVSSMLKWSARDKELIVNAWLRDWKHS